jgi:hypothetical protein
MLMYGKSSKPVRKNKDMDYVQYCNPRVRLTQTHLIFNARA